MPCAMTKLIFFIVLLTSLSLYSQNDIVHYLINEDSIANCSMIKSGKFLNEETNTRTTPGYSIEIRDNEVMELVNDGEFYMKSKIEFTSECDYQLTVLESTIPNDNSVGTKVYVEIVATSTIDKLIEIRTTYNSNTQIFVLRKIED